MKSLSGKDLCKLLEDRGWLLLRIMEAITYMDGKAASSGFLFRSTAIEH